MERYHRNFGVECVAKYQPEGLAETREVTRQYKDFYNYERPHQGLSCKNKPPGIAFPDLPALKSLPLLVDPDSWLGSVDGAHFVRKVRSDGGVSVDKYDYYVGQEWVGKYVGLVVVAEQKSFRVEWEKTTIKEIPIKGLYKRFLNMEEWQAGLEKEALAEQRGWRGLTG